MKNFLKKIEAWVVWFRSLEAGILVKCTEEGCNDGKLWRGGLFQCVNCQGRGYTVVRFPE